MAIVAVFGTTISPYLFFWQAGQEVEDTKEEAGARPLIRAPEQAEGEFIRIRIDTYIGMGISNLVALFIVITTAATLHAKGVTDIQTSAQAAEGLRSVAGPLTFAVFAAGIIGTGMLALPALARSAAYALGETLSALLLDEPQVRSQRCFGDCLGIVVIVLLPLHEGFDVDRRDNPRLVPQRTQRPADKVRAQAGFHADDARRQLLEGVFESQSPDLPPQGNLPVDAEPDEVKHFLADVDADDR
jgi:hypothetical protein